MVRKSEEVRNRQQRERQQKLRDADRKARRPNRDDIARTALFMTISSMAARDAKEVLEDFQDRVVRMLVDQGFDERQSDIVFEELVAKYRKGDWPFRRKVHLLHPDDPDQEA
ncbi:hypothetical protein [Agrobacterium tumefaciens]|uniref:hypothetical protein n=1 Tax=Agrobacterium tumefaciens TaxID=358 RepID=UPI0004599776|nr:hypothetical protein [Agrobacterium tumefaciens]CDN92221.1 hypothetical protein BN949_01363 [Agrobacterium tumefaciens]